MSPLIAAGGVDHTVCDHTFVLATVEGPFGMPALTERDAAANDIRGLLTLTTPTDWPTAIPGPVAAAPKP